MRLLEKALQSGANKFQSEISDEKIELAIAYLRNEITLSQVNRALEIKTGAASYATICICLKRAYILKLITLK